MRNVMIAMLALGVFACDNKNDWVPPEDTATDGVTDTVEDTLMDTTEDTVMDTVEDTVADTADAHTDMTQNGGPEQKPVEAVVASHRRPDHKVLQYGP